MAGLTQPAARLTLEESVALDTHEYTIERGLRTFYAVGNALAAIRDQRLYRATHFTFEQYCQDRWGMSRPRAYQLIAASDVHAHLSTVVDNPPTNERQARELARLPPDQQPVAWEVATEASPSGKPTAAQVSAAVEQLAILPSMPPANVLLSSSSEEWYTPPHIVERVVEFFGEIDLDPCSNSKTAPNVPAGSHYTKADDGLGQPWRGRVYMNPPYARDITGLWIQKLVAAYTSGTIEAGIALVAARTDTAWFWPLWQYPLCFVRGRLHFGSPDGKDNAATFPSVIACISTDREEFARCFGDLGHIVNEHRS